MRKKGSNPPPPDISLRPAPPPRPPEPGEHLVPKKKSMLPIIFELNNEVSLQYTAMSEEVYISDRHFHTLQLRPEVMDTLCKTWIAARSIDPNFKPNQE